MSILNYLRKRQPTAAVAKERLQIIISHERAQRHAPDYLPKLQEELLAVIGKYIPVIRKEKVKVHLERLEGNVVLEIEWNQADETLIEES